MGAYCKINVHLCTGGTTVVEDRKKLKENCHVVVGTPGRIHDMIKREYLKIDHLKVFVLDEADEMLGRGFLEQITAIFQNLPQDVQMGLFSATMPPEILELTKKFMRNPATILVKNDELTLEGIKQFYIAIEKEEWKFDTLIELFKSLEIQQCMIYANSKARVDELSSQMVANKFTVSSMVQLYPHLAW